MSQVQPNAAQLLPPALQGTTPNTTYPLTINTQAKHKLIHLLTNLYADPLTSMVREIIFNAIDATRLIPIAQRQPIDIHLPSKIEPFFAVTDHAGGMSPQEVKNVYLNYGTSTKDHNPQQIGAYGLGAKAPLSYTQTFVVTTVKDQQETTCVINLQQVQLYITKTSAANGTMVKIPLPDTWGKRELQQERKKFYNAVKTYAALPISGIKFTGLEKLSQHFHPYGEVIPCGTIQVAKQTLPVYWHCMDRPSRISGKRFFSCFEQDYANLVPADLPDSINVADFISVSAAIGGFEYPLSHPSKAKRAEFIIELKPGIVNFSSSHDEIFTDDKRERLLEAFDNQITASFFNTIKKVGLRNLVNAEMFPWAVRACAFFYLKNPELVSADPLLIKQLFTNQKHINLWELTPRPLALLDFHDYRYLEIEFKLTDIDTREELLDVIKNRFNDPQQRPSLFNIQFNNWNVCWYTDDEKYWNEFCQEGVINVFTDLNDFNLVKKVFRKRKKFIQATQKQVSSTNTNLPNILLLFQESQAQVQPVIEQILAGVPITINYFSRPETEQLLELLKPRQKNLYQVLQPFNSEVVDNALDFYQLCCDFQHSEIIGTPHPDLSLGLIVDSQPDTEVIAHFGEEILKTIFLFQAPIQLQVNLYRARKLKNYNMKQVQQQNDLVLCLHDFSTKNLQHYLSKLNLPARKITLSNQTPDLLLLLLYWSQILGQQPTTPRDYDSIRFLLEKLLQLHLLRHDPQLLGRFKQKTFSTLSDLKKSEILSLPQFNVPCSYLPLTYILNTFKPLYQVFNNILQSGKLVVQSRNTAQVQADIKFVQQYWQNIQLQKQQQTPAPLLDFNSYIVHAYLNK